MDKKKIVCFGPGPKFKGGISNYNTSLAKAFDALGHDVHIVSWTQQYPAIIPREFIDKSSRSDFLEGTTIQVEYLLNYNNPFSWYNTANEIIKLKPDFVVIQWAIAIQGIPLTALVKRLKKNGVRVIFDLHFVNQKEGSKLDHQLLKRTLTHVDEFITHSLMTTRELKELFPQRVFSTDPVPNTCRVFQLYHPVYSLFAPQESFDVEAFKKAHGLKKHVFLFFGFIRKYKGLHHALRAFHQLSLQRDDVSLLVCGESFWNTLDEKKLSTKIKTAVFGTLKSIFLNQDEEQTAYRPLQLIDELQMQQVAVFNEFIPNENVHKYFQASDAVLLFYEYATPSGIESLSYNFHKPILATKVGHFGETIIPGVNGYLAEAEDIASMVEVMQQSIENPIDRQNMSALTEKMSWRYYAEAILAG